MSEEEAPRGVDPHIPNAARMYDYYLGGKNNFAADRMVGDMVLGVAPEMREVARQGRELIARVVRHLVGEAGIRQIIDLGSGLPTQENVHEIAHRIAPDTRVVYVDHDEVVCAHGRALLAEPQKVIMLQGDLRKPQEIIDSPEVRAIIDFREPVAVLMMFLLHLVPDEDGPQEIVAAYRAALPAGGCLAVSHASTDARPETMARISAIYERANSPFVPRSREEISGFFGDFEMVSPGLVNVWPFLEPPEFVSQELASMGYSGVGRKL
ncbi:SAM-dependent methyltransferase [Streptosporangium lutulentum]|uniref:SAM-dependent methyltransferase n=1 Tax=Streptosporangium lutulentum TaxID=1461250 RepID=A0ABT9QTY8_9ACTN|nr:SAM-dependent methyltransferase [Streptosporangium lutulentum]MDP9850225.1 SAM-dependent methyltransferase [Streptosporangium lutulentum]